MFYIVLLEFWDLKLSKPLGCQSGDTWQHMVQTSFVGANIILVGLAKFNLQVKTPKYIVY